jgi:hypothetical protein
MVSIENNPEDETSGVREVIQKLPQVVRRSSSTRLYVSTFVALLKLKRVKKSSVVACA